jgi:hypothetical protein
MTIQQQWQWKEGVVDKLKEHIELRYGNAVETSNDGWIPIARISKPKRYTIIVEWLVGQDSPSEQTKIEEAQHQLDFFLVEHDIDLFPDHWEYAIYHCSTNGNMYGGVHWSYFPNGSQGVSHTSKVIEISAVEETKLFGDSRKQGKYIKK